MRILTIPNPILNIPAKRVDVFDKKLTSIVDEMLETLAAQHDPDGVGLAAPQIGLSLRLFVIKPKKNQPAKLFVNPEIVKRETQNAKRETNSKSKTRNTDSSKLEGCLSIPKIWGQVNREKKVYIRYQNIKGKWLKGQFDGFEAVIIQHELDHLDGILFTQRVLEQKGKLYKEEAGELKRFEI